MSENEEKLPIAPTLVSLYARIAAIESILLENKITTINQLHEAQLKAMLAFEQFLERKDEDELNNKTV